MLFAGSSALRRSFVPARPAKAGTPNASLLATFVLILLTAFLLRLFVLMPYIFEEAAKKSPEIRELCEKYPDWFLPKR